MKNRFFVLVDAWTELPVITMPSVSLCTEIMSKLPPRGGYKIIRVPMETKKLDVEFVEELSSSGVAHFYETLNEPTKPEDWYPNTATKPLPSDRV